MALTRATTHSTTADGTFSTAGATAWNAAHTNAITGATSGGIPYFDSTTTEATSALLAANAVVLGGGAGAAPLTSSKLSEGTTAGQGLIGAAGTATTDVQAVSWTQTWNNAGVNFTGFKYSITNTASGGSSFHSLWAGGAGGVTTLMSLTKNGLVTSSGGFNATAGNIIANAGDISLGNANYFYWSSRATIGSNADGAIQITNNAINAGACLDFLERVAPTGVANTARIYAVDNGGGKTQLMVIFGSGVAQQLAIEV